MSYHEKILGELFIQVGEVSGLHGKCYIITRVTSSQGYIIIIDIMTGSNDKDIEMKSKKKLPRILMSPINKRGLNQLATNETKLQFQETDILK